MEELGAFLSKPLVAKALTLAVVALVAALISHVLGRAVRKSFEKAGIAQASIIVNILRAIVWLGALMLVLQPVFGVQPTAFAATLGITSLIISLGMQDTLSNLMGGLSLMLNKTIRVGDVVTVGGKTGTITDITWRNTVLALRDGNTELIPNSVLSKTALTKLSEGAAIACTVDALVNHDADLMLVEREASEAVFHSLGALADRERDPVVRFGAMDAYGIKMSITAFSAEDVPLAQVTDRMSRALAGMPWLARANDGKE